MQNTGEKRVFILTDGIDTNPNGIIEVAKNESCSVHTVGIGDCDKDMLKKTSIAGRGTCNLIDDNDHESILNSKIITAL